MVVAMESTRSAFGAKPRMGGMDVLRKPAMSRHCRSRSMCQRSLSASSRRLRLESGSESPDHGERAEHDRRDAPPPGHTLDRPSRDKLGTRKCALLPNSDVSTAPGMSPRYGAIRPARMA